MFYIYTRLGKDKKVKSKVGANESVFMVDIRFEFMSKLASVTTLIIAYQRQDT